MSYGVTALSAISAVAVVLLAHGLKWSTTRRRIDVLRALSDLHAQIPPELREARDRVAREIDRSAESLSEWSSGAERRSIVAFGLGALVVGQVALLSAQVLLTSTENLEDGSPLYDLRPYALPLAVLGILALILGVMALVLLPILQWTQGWMSRRSDGNGGDAASDAVSPAFVGADETQNLKADETQNLKKESGAMKDEPSVDDAYLEHAVWLLEWHERRSEAFVTRSVGLLGFTGVLLAFVLQLVTRSGFEAGLTTYFALAAALGTLTASAWFALGAMKSQSVEAPGVDQLRDWWAKELEASGPAEPEKSIIERFLVGTDPGGESPLDSAATAANLRADRFGCASKLLFAGVVVIAVLVVDVTARG